MKLFIKNKRTKTELPSFLKTRLTRFNQQLHRTADYFQATTNNYPVKKKKCFLVVFVTVFALESTIITVRSFSGSKENFITVSRIRTIPLQKNSKIIPAVGAHELWKIQKFKTYIDSLSATPQGIKMKDSLLFSRPHLIDSINLLISLY